MEARRVRRVHPAVERVEQRPVDPRRGVDEPRRVGQVPRALFVDVDGGRGKGPGDVAHPAGVVEVDVGDGDAGQIVGPDPHLPERGQQDRDR